MTSSRQNPAPPTLQASALSGLLWDFSNCDSTREDGALAYRASRASPGGSDPEGSMWIYRMEGCDLGQEVAATLVSFTRGALTQKDADALSDPGGVAESYAPAATYESQRVFFAGSKAAARRLLDAFERVASESEGLAESLYDTDECGSGLEAILFEWPKGDMAIFTLCNLNYSEERRVAVEAILLEAERRFPGAVSDMESRSENSHTFANYEIWRDDDVHGEPPPECVLLALYDQSNDAQGELLDDPEGCERLARALHRREIERAAAPAQSRGAPKRV